MTLKEYFDNEIANNQSEFDNIFQVINPYSNPVPWDQIEYDPWDRSEPLKCYNNVENYINDHPEINGQQIFGWILHTVTIPPSAEGLLGMYHSLILLPNGSLYDITPKNNSEYIYFLENKNTKPDMIPTTRPVIYKENNKYILNYIPNPIRRWK